LRVLILEEGNTHQIRDIKMTSNLSNPSRGFIPYQSKKERSVNLTRLTKTITILALFTILCSACSALDSVRGYKLIRGKGNLVEETRQVSEFTGVNLANMGDLTITLGNTESLQIEAQSNLMQYIETEVVSGVLTIGTQARISLNPTRPIKYSLTVKDLDSIKISSSGGITAPDLQADHFSIDISSSGDLKMGNLNAVRLDVDINSSGNLDISGGEVNTQTVTIDSGGSYTASELKSSDAVVKINSSGTASIWVQDTLTVTLNSSGNLKYRGNPTVDMTTNSSGDVIHLDN
jgi:hypothetical protein